MLRIAALVLVGGVLGLSLRRDQPAFAFLISVCGAVTVLAVATEQLGPLLVFVQSMRGIAQGQSVVCLLQVLGIALVAQFAADTCRDAGMAAAAAAVDLCGRVLALLQALPLLQALIDAFLSCLQ